MALVDYIGIFFTCCNTFGRILQSQLSSRNDSITITWNTTTCFALFSIRVLGIVKCFLITEVNSAPSYKSYHYCILFEMEIQTHNETNRIKPNKNRRQVHAIRSPQDDFKYLILLLTRIQLHKLYTVSVCVVSKPGRKMDKCVEISHNAVISHITF